MTRGRWFDLAVFDQTEESYEVDISLFDRNPVEARDEARVYGASIEGRPTDTHWRRQDPAVPRPLDPFRGGPSRGGSRSITASTTTPTRSRWRAGRAATCSDGSTTAGDHEDGRRPVRTAVAQRRAVDETTPTLRRISPGSRQSPAIWARRLGPITTQGPSSGTRLHALPAAGTVSRHRRAARLGDRSVVAARCRAEPALRSPSLYKRLL